MILTIRSAACVGTVASFLSGEGSDSSTLNKSPTHVPSSLPVLPSSLPF